MEREVGGRWRGGERTGTVEVVQIIHHLNSIKCGIARPPCTHSC